MYTTYVCVVVGVVSSFLVLFCPEQYILFKTHKKRQKGFHRTTKHGIFSLTEHYGTA